MGGSPCGECKQTSELPMWICTPMHPHVLHIFNAWRTFVLSNACGCEDELSATDTQSTRSVPTQDTSKKEIDSSSSIPEGSLVFLKKDQREEDFFSIPTN